MYGYLENKGGVMGKLAFSVSWNFVGDLANSPRYNALVTNPTLLFLSTSYEEPGADDGMEFTSSGLVCTEGSIATKTQSDTSWTISGLTGSQINMGAGSANAFNIINYLTAWVWSPKKEQWYSLGTLPSYAPGSPVSVNTDQHLSMDMQGEVSYLEAKEPSDDHRIIRWEDFDFHFQMTAVYTDKYESCNFKEPIVNVRFGAPYEFDPDYF